MKIITAATSPPTRVASSGPMPMPSRCPSVAGRRDAVPLADVADEEDLARRRRRRERPEDRQLAQPPRRHDQRRTARRSRDRGPERDRGRSRPLRQARAPGQAPAIPGEGEPERGEDEQAVVPRQRGEAGQQAGQRRTTAAMSRAAPRAPIQSDAERPAAGRARSCPAGPCRQPTAAGSRSGSRPDGDDGGAPASRAIAQVSGAAIAPISANGSAEAQATSPKTASERDLDDRRQRHPVGVRGDRQHRVGRDGARRPRRRSR